MASKQEKQNKRKKLEGVVVSNKMTRAVVVRVSRKVVHPKYGKIVNRSKKYYARTDIPLSVGDNVVIEESRPLSKLIRWIVIQKK